MLGGELRTRLLSTRRSIVGTLSPNESHTTKGAQPVTQPCCGARPTGFMVGARCLLAGGVGGGIGGSVGRSRRCGSAW